MVAPRLAGLFRRGKGQPEDAATAEESASVHEATASGPGAEKHEDDGKDAEAAGTGGGAPLVQSVSTATENIVYPTGLRLALIMLSVFVSMFLVALVSRPALQSSPIMCSVRRQAWWSLR